MRTCASSRIRVSKMCIRDRTYGPLQTVKIENMRNQHTALSGSDAPAAPEAEPVSYTHLAMYSSTRSGTAS